MALWKVETKHEAAVRTNNRNALQGSTHVATTTSQQQQQRDREVHVPRPTQKNTTNTSKNRSAKPTATVAARQPASPVKTNKTKTAPAATVNHDVVEATPTPSQVRRRSSSTQRSSFLATVAAMMGPSKKSHSSSNNTSNNNNSNSSKKKTQTTTTATTRTAPTESPSRQQPAPPKTTTKNIKPVRQVDESSGATQPPPRRIKKDNATTTTANTAAPAPENVVGVTQQYQQQQPAALDTAKAARSKPRKSPPDYPAAALPSSSLPSSSAAAVPVTSSDPPELPSSIQFLQSLEVANQDRKQHPTKNMKKKKRTNHNHNINTNTQATPATSPTIPTQTIPLLPTAEVGKKNPSHPSKLSASRQRIIQAKLEEQRAAKAAAKMSRSRKYLEDDDMFVNDDELVQVDWFSINIQKKESSDNPQQNQDHDKDHVNSQKSSKTTKKQSKKLKQLRSTVEYSYPHYQWSTRQDMEHSRPISYRSSITIRKRRFDISNLLWNAEQQQQRQILLPRGVYQFDAVVASLQAILDRKHDKWWIQSRLPLYIRHEQETTTIRNNNNNNISCKQFQQLEQTMQKDDQLLPVEDQEQGWEILSIFFGDNQIDRDFKDHTNNNKDDDDNDSICHFSVAVSDVESVNFSDNDDFYNEMEESFNGKPREKVEVMPGDFTILRREEETYDAIAKGNYMSSLCLGCGTALVSVQDALQVACPSCGSITPLNGICLHRPFGIATGVKRSKCEHLLGPRKSPFIVAAAAEGDIEGNTTASSPKKPDGRKVAVTSYVRRSRTSISSSTGPAGSNERVQQPMMGTSTTTSTTTSPPPATSTTTTTTRSKPRNNSIPSPTAASPTASDRRRGKEDRQSTTTTSTSNNGISTNRSRSPPSPSPAAGSPGAVRARPSSKVKTTLGIHNSTSINRGSTGVKDSTSKTRGKSKRATKPGAVHAIS